MSEAPLLKQFLQHRHAILAYLNALTRDFATAEEVFQEVGLAIAQHARQETVVERFLPWALQVARRQAWAYFRANARRKRMVPWSEALTDELAVAFHENERFLALDQVRKDYLRECLQQLKGRSRQAIEQRYGLGRSIAAIASALHWKPASVKVVLSRARKWLHKCIQRKLREQLT